MKLLPAFLILPFITIACGSSDNNNNSTTTLTTAQTAFNNSCGSGSCHGSFGSPTRSVSTATTYADYQTAQTTVGAMSSLSFTQEEVELALSAL